MLFLLDKSVKMPKVKMPAVPGAKKKVQKPGSKGGKGYYDDKHEWHYGEKPVGTVSAPAVDSAHPEFVAPEVNSSWHNVKYASDFTVQSVDGTGVHIALANDEFHLISQHNWANWTAKKTIIPGGTVPFKEAEPVKEEAPPKEEAPTEEAPTSGTQVTPADIKFGAVIHVNNEAKWYYITSVDDDLTTYDIAYSGTGPIAEKGVAKLTTSWPAFLKYHPSTLVTAGKGIPSSSVDPAAKSPFVVKVGGVYQNSANGNFYHVTSFGDGIVTYDQVSSKNALGVIANGYSSDLGNFSNNIKTGTLVLVELVPIHPPVPANFTVTPAVDDVYYNKENDSYLHVSRVNPDDNMKAVKAYVTDKFEPDSYEAGNVSWMRDADWDYAVTGYVKVTEQQPIKNDIATLKPGDVFENIYNNNYIMVTGVDGDTHNVEYVTADNLPSIADSTYEDMMSATAWYESRHRYSFYSHIDQKPIETHPFKVGDHIVIDDGYGEDTGKIFYVSGDTMFALTAGAEQDNFHQLSVKEVNKKIARGKYQYLPQQKTKTKPEDLPVPPPVNTSPLPFKLPSVGDRFDGKYSNPRMRDINWKVLSIDDKNILIGPSYGNNLVNADNLTIPVGEWKSNASTYFPYIDKQTDGSYHAPEFDISLSEHENDSDENAKKRVCAGLFNRLASDPEFFDFAQKMYPEKMDYTMREQCGLPGERLADESPVVEQQGKVYLAVRNLVHLWAITSADTQSKAQCMQRAVNDEFGLNDAWNPLKSIEEDRLSADAATNRKAFKALVDNEYKEKGSSYRKFVRAQYEETQKFFSERNMKEITLYRGVLNAKRYVKFVKESDTPRNQPEMVLLQPQSSFTTHPSKAFDFATGSDNGVVYKTTVPVTRCVSTALTGVGCLGEHEVTLLGGPPEQMQAYCASDYSSHPESLGNKDISIWKSRIYPLDAIKREVDWLRHSGTKPYPIDEDIRDADWPKRTPNIPKSQIFSVLRTLGIGRSHLMKLPSGTGFARKKWSGFVRKSMNAATILLS